MSGRETAELLLLVGRLVQAEGYRGELSPAPNGWRSVSRPSQPVLAQPIGIRGISSDDLAVHSASQVIKVLEAGGYLIRQRSEADGRSVALRLTDKGKEAIAHDPFEALVRAVDSLDPEEQTSMHRALRRVLTTVAASGEHRCFGICQDCEYLERAGPGRLSECLLFGVPIEPEEAGLLCIHFSAKERAPRGPIP